MLEQYYRILNIQEGSDEETIKKAYRQIALRIHPDVNDSPDATERFRELCEAYEILLSQANNTSGLNLSSDGYTETVYNWEDVIREAREKAKERARMRYAKIKAEQELFEKSEWRDIIIFLKYFWSVLACALGIWLIVWPIYAIIRNVPEIIYAAFFFWAGGILLLRHIFKNRKNWFRHGHINFNMETVRNYFDFSIYTDVKTNCAYCKGHKGNGKPFKFSMLKIRDVKTRNDGPMQHYVNYNRKYKELFIPRSKKAFYVHFFLSVFKPLGIVAGSLFIPFPGIIWRFFFALYATMAAEWLILFITGTKSKVSFLLTPFQIIKLTIWTLVMLTQSYIQPGFILISNDAAIILMVVMLVFLDMILDLVLRLFPFHAWFYQPAIPQLPGLGYLFRNGYQPFLDIPIWSSLYPFFRWLF